MAENKWSPQNVLIDFSDTRPVIKSGDQKPPDPLQVYMSLYWWMSWNVPAGTRLPFLVVPTGCISLVFDKAHENAGLGSMIVGVRTVAYTMNLEGSGYMMGVNFAPAGAYPLISGDASSLTNDVAPLRNSLEKGNQVEQDVFAAEDFDRQCRILNETFSSIFPTKVDGNIRLVQGIFDFLSSIEYNPSIEEICTHFHVTERKLQRLFKEYVGITPKALIVTKRFQWASQVMSQGQSIRWAEFASELGYADQAHFIKDFKRITGQTPEEAKKFR